MVADTMAQIFPQDIFNHHDVIGGSVHSVDVTPALYHNHITKRYHDFMYV